MSLESRSLTLWLAENAPDCGDNSCLFGGKGKGGMRTNGGCRCYKDVRPDMRRIYIERMQAALSENAPTRERALLERIANANVIFPSMCANNGEAYTINLDLEEYRTKPRVER